MTWSDPIKPPMAVKVLQLQTKMYWITKTLFSKKTDHEQKKIPEKHRNYIIFYAFSARCYAMHRNEFTHF